MDGDLVKVIAWYDNEWGFANRMIGVARVMGQRMGPGTYKAMSAKP